MHALAVAEKHSWYNGFIRETPELYGKSGTMRLKPTNDFLFQKLFGEEEAKDILTSFLNAILHLPDHRKITDIRVIANTQLNKELLTSKGGRLDILAETENRELINVEMQLTNYRDMVRRTLFYSSRLFHGSIRTGEDFKELKRTITINIMDFNLDELSGISDFHSTFHFYETILREVRLTDAVELHFIELPKFRKAAKDLSEPLHRWLLFLEEKPPENELEAMMEMDEMIRKAEERLEYLSADEETIRLYEWRENARIEWNSWVNEARRQGLEQGIQEGIQQGIQQGIELGKEQGIQQGARQREREIVLSMLRKGLDPAFIAEVTGLSMNEISEIQE